MRIGLKRKNSSSTNRIKNCIWKKIWKEKDNIVWYMHGNSNTNFGQIWVKSKLVFFFIV